MRLNPDCIRAILLFVEDHPPGAEIVIPEKLPDALSQYSFQEVQYHAEQCDQSGFLNGFKHTILGEIKIDSLTPEGNKFLDTIRPDTVWEKTKATAAKVGSASLDFISKTAPLVFAEWVKKQL